MVVTRIASCLCILILAPSCTGFSLNNNQHKNPKIDSNDSGIVAVLDRRQIIQSAPAALATLLVLPQTAKAGIDPNALKNFKVEGDDSGAAMRLRQLNQEEDKTKPEDLVNIPYEKLTSGVSYREYREGKGEATIQQGSKVAVEMTIRCRSFATADEPGGLKYFSSKTDTDFNEVAWTIGSGELLPGLEEGMAGMKKGGLRRIEVPSTMVFSARNANQLPLPAASNKDGKRRFDNLFKTDATLLFEVLVTRIK